MLTIPRSVRIFLSSTAVDMRKGFDGLSRLVTEHFDEDVYSGHLFVFVSRRADRVKILAWDSGGFVLYYKRLEKGRFRVPQMKTSQKRVLIEPGELSMLLDGVDFSRVARPKRWTPPRTKALDTAIEV